MLAIGILGDSGCVEQRLHIVVIGDMANAGGDFGHHFADGVSAALVGSSVVVTYVDDYDNSQVAKRQAKSVAQDPRVLLVIGHSASATTIAAIPVYVASRLALIAPIATADDLTDGSVSAAESFVFRLPPPNRYQARAVVRALRSRATNQLLVMFRQDHAYSSNMERELASNWGRPDTYSSIDLGQLSNGAGGSFDSYEVGSRVAEALRSHQLADAKPALVFATYYKDLRASLGGVLRARKMLNQDFAIAATDGGLHPEVGPAFSQEAKGTEFFFVGPSWQEFDPDRAIFRAYQGVHQGPGHPQRPDQPTSWEAMWPSFIEYGYLAGTIARLAVQAAVEEGDPTKRGVLTALRRGRFQTRLPAWPTFGFCDPGSPGVREPCNYTITSYSVQRVWEAHRLDRSWLDLGVSYSEKDLR